MSPVELVETLIRLANLPVTLIPEVTEVITPVPLDIPVSGQPSVRVTGARVEATPCASPVREYPAIFAKAVNWTLVV